MDFKVARTFEMIAREGIDSTQAVALSQELKRRLMAKFPQAKTFAEAVMMVDKEVTEADAAAAAR